MHNSEEQVQDKKVLEEKVIEKKKTLEKAFHQMRAEELGLGESMNEAESKEMIKSLEEFTDWCVSCSLMDPSTRDTVLEVNKHQHFQKSCKKKSSVCKYGFPRYPLMKTIIAVPARVLYKDDQEKEKFMIEKSCKVKEKVAAALENENIIEKAQAHRNEEIMDHLGCIKRIKEIDLITEFKDHCRTNKAPNFNIKVSDELLTELELDIQKITNADENVLLETKQKYKGKCLANETLYEIRKERLDIILDAADIDGNSFEERNINYEEALQISKKGY